MDRDYDDVRDDIDDLHDRALDAINSVAAISLTASAMHSNPFAAIATFVAWIESRRQANYEYGRIKSHARATRDKGFSVMGDKASKLAIPKCDEIVDQIQESNGELNPRDFWDRGSSNWGLGGSITMISTTSKTGWSGNVTVYAVIEIQAEQDSG